jgi:hypothetical protein
MVPPGNGFQVHPDELATASAAADTIAARLPAQAHRLTAATDRAADGLCGWHTAAALRSCTEAWRALLDRLHTELADQGGRLDGTARRYRAGEHAAADAFRLPAARAHLGDSFNTAPAGR